MEADPLIAYEDDPEGDTVHQPYTAFNQGFEAGEQGIPKSLNPYAHDSREEHWWDMGHEEAIEQLTERLSS